MTVATREKRCAERVGGDRQGRGTRLRARVRPGAHRSQDAGDARDALQHRLDQQAVHGRRQSCCSPRSGKLSLDDTVGKWLPDLTRGDGVTIRQLLSMTSGYQDYWPQDYVMPGMLQPIDAEQILDALGAEAARLRARHEVAVQQHQLRHRRR